MGYWYSRIGFFSLHVSISVQLLLICKVIVEWSQFVTDFFLDQFNLSRVVRKLAFCICENIDVDQLRGNREVDQRLCFRYIASTIPLLPINEISSL